MLLVVAFSPVYAQTDAPSKYEMKKDGDGDGVRNEQRVWFVRIRMAILPDRPFPPEPVIIPSTYPFPPNL